jgi:AcrR family transcriptional regulator
MKPRTGKPRTPVRRQPGRPRTAGYDRKILQSALQLLVEKGYAGFTIDGVAARTGVARPTIYRRWPSKAALAAAAIDRGIPLPEPPDTGSLREDLVAFQHARLEIMNDPANRAVVAGLVSESVADPDLAEAFLGWYRHRNARPKEILERAIERGELPAGIDLELINDLLLGPLFLRSVVRGERLDPSLVDETVDVVLSGFGHSSRMRGSSQA